MRDASTEIIDDMLEACKVGPQYGEEEEDEE